MIFTTHKKLSFLIRDGQKSSPRACRNRIFSNIEMLLNEELVNEKIKMSFDARVDVTTTCN